MGKNSDLHKAREAKMDEWYTRREDIEAELSHYEKFFKGKTVYCNCDDPETSEFWQFFKRNFKPWELKRLIATHYEPDEKNYAYFLDLSEDTNGDGIVDWNDEPAIKQLPCNGDFRSAACVELLEQADIVVTNPPFSLVREYIAQLVEHNKDFIIMAPLNAVKYKEIFPLIKSGKITLGYKPTGKDTLFRIPEDYAEYLLKNKKEGSGYKIINGEILGRANVIWLTSLDIEKRYLKLDLRGNYYRKENFPKYLNYDAIDVDKVSNIPCDYEGNMGVPISFLDSFNSAQFDIIGLSHAKGLLEGTQEIGEQWIADYRAIGKTGHLSAKSHDMVGYVDGKPKAYYPRVIIKNKEPEPRRYPDED